MTTEAVIPALVPPRSPQELREWTVEDFTVMNRSQGLPDAREVVERQVVRDLELYDAVKREHPVPLAPTPSDVAEQRATRQEKIDARAAEKGATIQRQPGQVVSRPNIIEHGRPTPGSRWSYALGRLKRIVAGATNHPNPVIATSTCEMPKLALEVYRMYAQVATRRVPMRPGDEANPFYGLSQVDFGRVLQRKIEDIADRSSGRLGPWFVPK